ncbi:MAG: deoxyguanosinetriphosphate triphosphohydrolase [Deltaproteobacteria bacterium]|jgi:dGTPase|nr:deoxyguanosinetriphosphate triphosphohydrolase [Deltaproteobacteria bacterium]
MEKPKFYSPGELLEARLSPLAASAKAASRSLPEEPCPWRTDFQRDRDRIIHCRAFRRLAHKTQVLIATTGDHYRTRLTHTLEVSLIARTLARGFALNEDLAEAVSLGHDLGHTPFGHAGERCLARLHPGGFRHQDQSVRVVTVLAKRGEGLNLTGEVIDGIRRHSKGRGPIFAADNDRPLTLEAQLVRAADIIAYMAHDLDDAIEAGLVAKEDVPKELNELLGNRASTRIGHMVTDLLTSSQETESEIKFSFSLEMSAAMEKLRTFLNDRVYNSPQLKLQLNFAETILSYIYAALMEDDSLFQTLPLRHLAGDRSQAVCDFISGMTDRYAFAYSQNLVRGLPPGKFGDLEYAHSPYIMEF